MGPYTPSGTLDTSQSSTCTRVIPQAGGPELCLRTADTITISQYTRWRGPRPLVLLAVNTITVTQSGVIDVSSSRGPAGAGAGANTGLPTWVSLLAKPARRFGMSLAYDTKRGRVLMLGGRGGRVGSEQALDDVWQWRAHWERVPASPTPPARLGAAVAYDVERGELVMFGGHGFSHYADTQIWTGGAWIERNVIGPTPRSSAAMTYDAVGRRVVLFGGATSAGDAAADTWIWDGTSWTELVSPQTPPGSSAPSMAYDPKTDDVLLASAGQTWRLRRDGVWQSLFNAPSPTARLVFDPASQEVVAYTIDASVVQLYRRGSSGWTAAANTALANIETGALVPDVLRGRLVLVSQRSVDDYPAVWEWDGASWSLMPGIGSAGSMRAVALDTKRRRAIVLDSSASTVSFDTLGETMLNPATSPTPRTFALAAYDERRDRVVLFGGFDSQSTILDDTWEWDGQTWTDVSTTTRPPPAALRAMAYDRGRGKVVLVGGAQQTQMWEWDGTAWQASPLPAALQNRTGPALAYDPIRERLVWFGGQDASTDLDDNDIWTLEPTGWMEHDPPLARPAPRTLASLAWDANRRRLVLYGGRNDDLTIVLGDVWEWDGARWYTVPAPHVPSLNHRAFTAFDGSGIIVVTASGTDRFVWRGTNAVETCALPFDVDGDSLIGCADPDCWFACAPLCPPETTCGPPLPSCGDQQCAPSENGFTCAADCTAPASYCGNAVCEAEMTNCPGDCPP